MKGIDETERLVLKILDKTYARQVVDYYQRNKKFLEEWEYKKTDKFFTIEFQEKVLTKELNDMEKGTLFKVWMFEKSNPNRVIGSVGFSNIIRGIFQSCFLGYKMDKDLINRGYMTEALESLIDIAFNKIYLHRIEANIMPKNVRSLRVAQKLGFVNEGTSKDYLKINGKWEDHIHMVLLNKNPM